MFLYASRSAECTNLFLHQEIVSLVVNSSYLAITKQNYERKFKRMLSKKEENGGRYNTSESEGQLALPRSEEE